MSTAQPTSPDHTPGPSDRDESPRILITAGPTHEPVDRVRYLANRSSGRLGIALAEAAATRRWPTTLLLGPTPREPSDTTIQTLRFHTAADLERLLSEHLPSADILVMAAAVADYRPRTKPGQTETKIRRTDAGLTLELEPVPDLLAGASSMRRPGQKLIGFALEPRDRLLDSARSKLARKRVDAIVANPLDTMDATSIEATLVRRDGDEITTPARMSKEDFAPWLLDQIMLLPTD